MADRCGIRFQSGKCKTEKNKLSKRLLPIKLIEGELKDEIIKYNDHEIGKVLIKNKFPFASIKYLNDNFDEKKEFTCGNAKIKVMKPSWLKLI